jgi:hypothetical protein
MPVSNNCLHITVQQGVLYCGQFRGAERLGDMVADRRFNHSDASRLEYANGQHDDGQVRPSS